LNTCNDINDLLQLRLQIGLVVPYLHSKRLNSFMHQLLPLLVLPKVVVDSLVHCFLRFREPK